MENLLDNKKIKNPVKKNMLNFLFKVTKNEQIIQRYQTRSKRRFYNRLRMINWQNGSLKVYLRVSYGQAMSNKGKLENFYNDGHYETKEDLLETFRAFTEPGLLKDFIKEVRQK